MRAPILLALVATAFAGTAMADSPKPEARRVIGILDIRVEGMPAEVASQFQNSLETQLDSKRYWLSGRSKMRERMLSSTRWADGCLVGKCLFDVKTQTGAELVIVAALSGSGTSYGYVVTLLRTDIGTVVAQQTDRCDVCTLNEAMTNATLATIQLINAVPDKLPDDEAERHASVELATGPLQKELAKARRANKTPGIVLTVAGLAVAAAGVAVYFAADKPSYAPAIWAAGGGLALGGVTILAF